MKILVTCAHGTSTGPIMKNKVELVLQEFEIPFEKIDYCAIVKAKDIAEQYDVIFCATSFASLFKNAAAMGTVIRPFSPYNIQPTHRILIWMTHTAMPFFGNMLCQEPATDFGVHNSWALAVIARVLFPVK